MLARQVIRDYLVRIVMWDTPGQEGDFTWASVNLASVMVIQVNVILKQEFVGTANTTLREIIVRSVLLVSMVMPDRVHLIHVNHVLVHSQNLQINLVQSVN